MEKSTKAAVAALALAEDAALPREAKEHCSAANRWRCLVPMALAYSLGTFNDNFFKQSVLFLAIAIGSESIQSLGAILYALPFIFCSAWAGWWADRISKRRIMILAKCLEVAAALVGAFALCFMNFAGMLGMIFLMAVQSTLFSPAINGSIPENFTTSGVPAANAILKMSTTASILCGIALSGLILDLILPNWPLPWGIPFGHLAVSVVVVLTAVIGLIAVLFLPKSRLIAPTKAPFPWLGAWDSLRHAYYFYVADRLLLLALCAEAFFYFMGALAVLIINNLGVNEYHLSKTYTGCLAAAVMVGICLGSIAASRVSAGRWAKSLFPGGLLMAGTFLLVPAVALLPVAASFTALMLLLALAGAGGGFFLIPTVSFIQIRPPENARGKTLGVSNFLSFCGVALSGAVFWPLSHLIPSWGLAACGGITLLFLIGMLFGLRQNAAKC